MSFLTNKLLLILASKNEVSPVTVRLLKTSKFLDINQNHKSTNDGGFWKIMEVVFKDKDGIPMNNGAKEYEKIREKFGDSLIVRRPSGNYTNAVKIENWENYGATYDSMTRNIISIIPMKMSPNGYRFVDVFFNQNIYSDTIIDESRRFERYWINSETEKIAALSVIMEEE